MTLNRINWSWNYRDVIRLETDIHSKDGVQKGLADPFGSLNIWERRLCCRLDGSERAENLEIGRCGPVFWCMDLPKPKSAANVCLQDDFGVGGEKPSKSCTSSYMVDVP